MSDILEFIGKVEEMDSNTWGHIIRVPEKVSTNLSSINIAKYESKKTR